MSSTKTPDYHLSASFCDANYYSAEDVVKIISEATVHHQLCCMPDKRDIAIHMGILKTSENEFNATEQFKAKDLTVEPWLAYNEIVKDIYYEEELRDQKFYFMDRMIKSILNHEIEFWNSDATKVIDLSSIDLGKKNREKPSEAISVEYALKKIDEHNVSILDGSYIKEYKEKPKNQIFYSPLHRSSRYHRQYNDIEYWISRSIIQKSDLIKFCKNQKIEAIFIKLNEESNLEPGIPGQIPRTSVGKLATSIAWEIEKETKEFAKPENVIAVLQRLADEGKHSEFLFKRLNDGVEWITDKFKHKPYTLNGCKLALKKWKKSREIKKEKS